MGWNYESIDKLRQSNVKESDIFSIDVVVDIQPNDTTNNLTYEIIHRLPYQGSPNGKIFLGSFDSGSHQFDDRWFPYYEQLTRFVAEITEGKVETRNHACNFAVSPALVMTPPAIFDWIKKYEENKDIKGLLGRIRLK